MSALLYAAMVFALQFVPVARVSVDAVTPRDVPGYVECEPGQVTVHVRQVLDVNGIRSPLLEQLEAERQWLVAADCVDDGVMNGSPAPFTSDEPFLATRVQLWSEWALANRVETTAMLLARRAGR